MMIKIFSKHFSIADQSYFVMNTFFFTILEYETDEKILRAIKKQMPGFVPTYWLIPIHLEV